MDLSINCRNFRDYLGDHDEAQQWLFSSQLFAGNACGNRYLFWKPGPRNEKLIPKYCVPDLDRDRGRWGNRCRRSTIPRSVFGGHVALCRSTSCQHYRH